MVYKSKGFYPNLYKALNKFEIMKHKGKEKYARKKI